MFISDDTMMFILAAFMMMIGNGSNTYVLFSCSFLKGTNSTIGLLLMEEADGSCSSPHYLYDSTTTTTTDTTVLFWTDSWLWLSRIVGFLSCALGLILWILMWSSIMCRCCCSFDRWRQGRRCRLLFGLFALLCTMLSATMFTAFLYSDCNNNNSGGCNLGFSSTINIITVIFYFTSSMTCFFFASSTDEKDSSMFPTITVKSKKRKKNYNYMKGDDDEEQQQQTKEQQQTNNSNSNNIPSDGKLADDDENDNDNEVAPSSTDNIVTETTTNADGTTVTKKITNHSDGSKTIEETVVSPMTNTMMNGFPVTPF